MYFLKAVLYYTLCINVNTPIAKIQLKYNPIHPVIESILPVNSFYINTVYYNFLKTRKNLKIILYKYNL